MSQSHFFCKIENDIRENTLSKTSMDHNTGFDHLSLSTAPTIPRVAKSWGYRDKLAPALG